MTIQGLNFPDSKPALVLDFAKAKRLDPRITFSRASSATYFDKDGVMRTAPINVARFDHDPATGESLGLLIEEARTNRLRFSNFGNALIFNSLSGASRTIETAITAPDGTNTGVAKITATAGNGPHGYNHSSFNTFSSATQAVGSVYVKKGNHRFVAIEARQPAGGFQVCVVDLDTRTGVNGSTGLNGVLRDIEVLPNGWFRISGYASNWHMNGNANCFTISLFSGLSPESGSWAANGGEHIYIWGPQIEVGESPTSYIPTPSNSAVTRSADVARMTGANFSSWYNQSESTMYIEDRGRPSGGSGGKGFAVSGPGSNFSRIGAFTGGINSGFDNFAFSVSQDVSIASGTNPSEFNKTAAGLADNNTSVAVNGSLVGTDTSCQISGRGMNAANIGDNAAASAKLNGTIKRIAYWRTRLPDAVLQRITIP